MTCANDYNTHTDTRTQTKSDKHLGMGKSCRFATTILRTCLSGTQKWRSCSYKAKWNLGDDKNSDVRIFSKMRKDVRDERLNEPSRMRCMVIERDGRSITETIEICPSLFVEDEKELPRVCAAPMLFTYGRVRADRRTDGWIYWQADRLTDRPTDRRTTRWKDESIDD